MKDIEWALAITAAVVLVVLCLCWSLVVIWAWDTIFPALYIDYTWRNWLAVSILISIFKNYTIKK